MKTRIYYIATRVFDWHIPVISWLADQVRDACYNPDLYY